MHIRTSTLHILILFDLDSYSLDYVCLHCEKPTHVIFGVTSLTSLFKHEATIGRNKSRG